MLTVKKFGHSWFHSILHAACRAVHSSEPLLLEFCGGLVNSNSQILQYCGVLERVLGDFRLFRSSIVSCLCY